MKKIIALKKALSCNFLNQNFITTYHIYDLTIPPSGTHISHFSLSPSPHLKRLIFLTFLFFPPPPPETLAVHNNICSLQHPPFSHISFVPVDEGVILRRRSPSISISPIQSAHAFPN